MPELTIELRKATDSRPNLTCVRADGTRTWARVHPFFPAHELTHCAVESVMGFDQAFFGLVASGWEVDAFAAPGAAARTPEEALCAENIVGLLERGVATDSAELNAALTASMQAQGANPRAQVSEAQFSAIRTLRASLVSSWHSLPPGETLRVEVPASFSIETFELTAVNALPV